ncbi:MAG: hypothetical protein ACTSYB_00280 [Candidatus Helarchaeota archaeon]
MSEILSVVIAINFLGLEDIVIISDGRFSGASYGLIYIGHVAPEAYIGGPIALIRDGDLIKINIKDRTINVALSPEDLENRSKSWKPPKMKNKNGVLAMWAQIAEQADKGAVLKSFI